MISIIESKLTFFEVLVTGGFSHTAKLHQAYFGKAPEAFDAVNVISADGKFIVRMIDPIVLVPPHSSLN